MAVKTRNLAWRKSGHTQVVLIVLIYNEWGVQFSSQEFPIFVFHGYSFFKKMFATKVRSELLTVSLSRKINTQLNETRHMVNLGHNEYLCQFSEHLL